MTNVLVTGCTGFVGSNLAIKLVNEGFNMYGLVRHISRRELAPLALVLDRIHLAEGDLTQYHSMRSIIKGVQPQFILHLGAITPVRLSFEDPYPYISTNFGGTVNIVHAIVEEMPKARLILASTAEVYGWQNTHKPMEETERLNPASPYAVSKEAADQYVRMAIRVYDLKATVLRPNNTYGRRGEKGFIVEYLVSSMLKGESCHIGAPESIRDYMYIDDHVKAYLLAMESERAVGEAFNVSPGNPVTNRELASLIAGLTSFKGKIVYRSYPPGYPQRPAAWDPDYLVLDSTKIRKRLGWKPSVSLKEGLNRTIDAWKKQNK